MTVYYFAIVAAPLFDIGTLADLCKESIHTLRREIDSGYGPHIELNSGRRMVRCSVAIAWNIARQERATKRRIAS